MFNEISRTLNNSEKIEFCKEALCCFCYLIVCFLAMLFGGFTLSKALYLLHKHPFNALLLFAVGGIIALISLCLFIAIYRSTKEFANTALRGRATEFYVASPRCFTYGGQEDFGYFYDVGIKGTFYVDAFWVEDHLARPRILFPVDEIRVTRYFDSKNGVTKEKLLCLGNPIEPIAVVDVGDHDFDHCYLANFGLISKFFDSLLEEMTVATSKIEETSFYTFDDQ